MRNQNGKNNHMYKHGMSNSPTYNTWHLMLARCRNKNAPDYSRYGGRGIAVCKKWYKFEKFVEDMGMRPSGKTLDRINNSLGYSKENCRWATKKEQHRNTRQNKWIEYNGEKRPMCEWCDILGLNYGAVRQRIGKGWPINRAFTEKVRLGKRPKSAYVVA